ncbi:DegV family protein, partial [Chloroflexota bacterium]
MAVKIITDSVADLPPQVAKELGITIIPLNVRFGTEIYRDGIDLTSEQFYDRLVHSEVLPFTTAPSPGDFTEAYDRLAEEADEILAIIVSSKLSVTYEVAAQGRELRKSKRRLEIIDTQWGIMAEGLVVITAAKAANSGASLDEVMNLTHRNIRRVDLHIAFDTLKYLKKGGRIGAAQAFLGSMLKTNPILTLKDGSVQPVTRERSRTKAIDYLYNFVTRFSHIEEMAIEDANTPGDAEMLAERIGSRFPKE